MNLYVKVYFVIPNNMSRSTYFDKSVGEEISKKFMLPVKYCSCRVVEEFMDIIKLKFARTVKNALPVVDVKKKIRT